MNHTKNQAHNKAMNKKSTKRAWVVGVGILGIATIAYAASLSLQTAPKVAAERAVADFDVQNAVQNSGIKDGKTGLVWQACLVGQTYTNGKCDGTPTEVKSSEEAVKLATADWRLPTIKELTSISDHRTMYPAVNTEVFVFASTLEFDDTKDNPAVWSSSIAIPQYSGDTEKSYALALSNGEVLKADKATGDTGNRTQARHVLLVKTGS